LSETINFDIDLKALHAKLNKVVTPIELIFHPIEEGSDFSSGLFDYAKSLEKALGGLLKVRMADGGSLPGKPGFTLSYEGRSNINYMALPTGPEAPPFMEALSGLVRNESVSNEDWAVKLDTLEEPAEVLVFMAPPCPNCPHSVDAAIRVALASPIINTTIIDVQQYPELSKQFGVRSVPMTILDRGLSTVGIMKEEALVEQILSRGSDEFEHKVFISIIESGRFDDAVNAIKQGRGASCFFAAWKGSATSLRIGLLLASESALEEDSAILDGLVPELLTLLDSEDTTLRGDTADLLGRIGHTSAIERLERLLDDPNPDVAEIAFDALDEIRSCGRSY